MKSVREYFQDFIALFFPELCAACGINLIKNESSLCTTCIFQLPRTHFQLGAENPLAHELWGRFPFIHAGAFVYFRKGNNVQHIIHQLKYNGRHDSGFRMGELYGLDLKHAQQGWDVDLIIPVPIHPNKKDQRGYNQSECIALGLSSVLRIPVSTNHLIKRTHTSSQTKKSRLERQQNLKESFIVQNGAELKGKHLLLIDDVLTTGATLEACAKALTKLDQVHISIASIALATE